MKKLLSLLAASLILASAASKAAVLVTTGTDGSGKAYIELPQITFQITANFSTSGFALVFRDVLPPSTSASYGASGSGLSVFSPSNGYAFVSWSAGPSGEDAALFVANSSYDFVSGQTYTVQAGRFTLTNATPINFPVFASGVYDLVLQDTMVDGRVLSAPAQAVPEPSTVALLGTFGLAVIFFRRRLA